MSNAQLAFGFLCMLIIACMLYSKWRQANEDNDDWPSGGAT